MNKDKAMQQALEQPPVPVQEPANASTWWTLVICAAAELENASTCLRDEDAKRSAISGAKYYRDAAKALRATPPLPVQEPVAWDRPSASFNDWWDSDLRGNANPFTTDSFSYWAFEGWQAALAQRPWVGLTEEEIMVIGDKVANEQLVGPVANFRMRFARAVEQTLKERNHD